MVITVSASKLLISRDVTTYQCCHGVLSKASPIHPKMTNTI